MNSVKSGKAILNAAMLDMDIQLSTKWKGHYYSAYGEKQQYPSATTLLGILDKSGLIGWHDKLAREKFTKLTYNKDFNPAAMHSTFDIALNESNIVRDKSAEFGTAVHKGIENFINDPDHFPLELKDEQVTHFNNAIEFLKDHKIKPLKAEYKIFNTPEKTRKGMIRQTPGYGGTIDFIGFMEETDQYCIIDWKTGNSLYDTHLYQLAAYAMALNKIMPINRAFVFATKKGEHREIKSKKDMDLYFEKFCRIAAAYSAIRKTQIYDGGGE